MRLVCVLRYALPWVLALLVASPAASAPPKAQPPTSQDILKWINGYRGNPEPQQLAASVHAMSGLGLFKDLEASGVYIGFVAGVLASNPDKAEAMIAKMFPMPPEDQVAIIRAIAYSGLPEWKSLLGQFAERMPARIVLIQRHIADKAPTLKTMAVDQSPAALDTLWGFYFGSGRFEPIDRIIGVLAWAKDANNVERLTLGSMAKWTLANNALADKDLLDHLKIEVVRQPKEIVRELREVIEAAEIFETSKIRREALASIEDLKRKGPDSTRKFTWWGQAGQTALALGCVAASALGHAEIGIPCVLGGAVSSAALKVFTPQ